MRERLVVGPVLLHGPTGVGKSCLSHAVLRDLKLQPVVVDDIDELELMMTSSPVGVGVVVDDLDGLDVSTRQKVVGLVKSWKRGMPLMILVADGVVLDKKHATLKTAAAGGVVKMQLPSPAECAQLAAHVLSCSGTRGLPKARVDAALTEAHGDLRKLVMLLECEARFFGSVLPSSLKHTYDVFDTPWSAAERVLRDGNAARAEDVYGSDAFLVPRLLQENYARLPRLDVHDLSACASSLSDSLMLDGGAYETQAEMAHVGALAVAEASRASCVNSSFRPQFPCGMSVMSTARARWAKIQRVAACVEGTLLSSTCTLGPEDACFLRDIISAAVDAAPKGKARTAVLSAHGLTGAEFTAWKKNSEFHVK